MSLEDSSHRARLIAAFAAIYLIWGSTYLAIRMGVGYFPPAAFAAIRFLISAPLLFAFAFLRGRSLRASPRELLHAAIVGCMLFIGGNFLVVWAEQYVASGLASLIVAGVPLWMTGLEQFRKDGERVSGLGWVGIVIGFAGVFLLIDPGSLTGAPSDGRTGLAAFAEIALVGSSLLWSVGSIYSKHATLPRDTVVSTSYQMLFGGLALLLLALGQGEFAAMSFAAIPAKAWWVLVYLVVVGSCLGLTAYVWLIQNAPAAQVATYAYVNPVVAVALGYVILDEPVGLRTLLGMGVIFAGVALVSRAKIRAKA